MTQLAHILSLTGELAAALAAASWQGLLLTAAMAALLALMPNLGASRRWIVWSGVFLLGVALNLEPLLRADSGTGVLTAAPGLHLGQAWGVAIAFTWFALSALRIAGLLREGSRLRRLTRTASSVTIPASCQTLLCGRRPVTVCASVLVTRPSVAGFWRPRILLPADLMERLSEPELFQVLLHEMEHVRRGDDWTNLLQKVALALFPLDPALFLIDRRLCVERELACDDHVLRQTGAPKAYAACLARLAEGNVAARGLALALGAWEQRSELAKRVYRILGQPAQAYQPRWAAPLRRVQTGLVAALLLAAAAILPRVPALVSFHDALAVGNQTANQTANVTSATWRPASSSYHARSMRGATLVKAIMPMPGTAHPIPSLRAGKQSRSVRLRTANRLGAITTQPPMRRVSVEQQRLSKPEPRMLLTRFEQEQVSTPAVYTVIRVPDGWLVIQL